MRGHDGAVPGAGRPGTCQRQEMVSGWAVQCLWRPCLPESAAAPKGQEGITAAAATADAWGNACALITPQPALARAHTGPSWECLIEENGWGGTAALMKQQGAYMVVVGTKLLLLKPNVHEALDQMVRHPRRAQSWHATTSAGGWRGLTWR